VLPFDQLNAYDVLCADDVVFTKAALDSFLESPVVTKVTAKESAQ
jgi:large subunit ribosomal protein L4